MTYDPTLFEYKTVFMQRIADYVRLGYRYWSAGTVSRERAVAFVQKFNSLYGVGQSRHQRAYARQKGQASAVLLLFAPSSHRNGQSTATEAEPPAHCAPTSAVVEWILLITLGEHIAHRLEKLQDALTAQGRIRLTGYELVQRSRTGQAKPAWTWSMTSRTYDGWRARLIGAARRNHTAVQMELAQLARTPGFAGCRAQGKKLQRPAKAELRRRYPALPTIAPPRLYYVQRLPDSDLTLRKWVRTCQDRRAACNGANDVKASP